MFCNVSYLSNCLKTTLAGFWMLLAKCILFRTDTDKDVSEIHEIFEKICSNTYTKFHIFQFCRIGVGDDQEFLREFAQYRF